MEAQSTSGSSAKNDGRRWVLRPVHDRDRGDSRRGRVWLGWTCSTASGEKCAKSICEIVAILIEKTLTSRGIWRECMGIEPTGGLFPSRPLILKTRAGTSRTHTPLGPMRKRIGLMTVGLRGFGELRNGIPPFRLAIEMVDDRSDRRVAHYRKRFANKPKSTPPPHTVQRGNASRRLGRRKSRTTRRAASSTRPVIQEYGASSNGW